MRLNSWLYRLNQERLSELVLAALLLLSYGYFFPRWADPNQNSRLDMVVAVVEDGTFQIDPYVANTVDYAKVGEHYYSDKAPGTAFLGIPIYAGLKVFLDLPVMDGLMEKLSQNSAFQATLREGGTGILEQKVRFAIAQVVLAFLLAGVPTAILGVMMYRLARRFTPSPGPRLGMVLVYGLLTPAFAYAGALYGHQLSTALLFGAFYIVFMRSKPLTIAQLLAVGALLAYSVITEYPVVLAAGIVFVYTAWAQWKDHRWQGLGWVLLSGGLLGLGWMAYNNTVFGGPLSLGYSYSEQWVEQHQTGFMSLTSPTPQVLWELGFGVFRGLFVLSPILVLAVPGFALWWQARTLRAEFWVALAVAASITLFNASSIMWWGGFAVGPRYLLPMLPFLALPLVLVFKQWGHRGWFRLAAGALALLSLAFTWGLTLAGQAFPSDEIRNPLLQYALPNWQAGNIARNLGTLLGLPGIWSLLPLGLALTLLGVGWVILTRRKERVLISARPAMTSGVEQ